MLVLKAGSASRGLIHKINLRLTRHVSIAASIHNTHCSQNYLGNSESIEDLTILRDTMQRSRRFVAETPEIKNWIAEETWPG